MSAVPCEGSNSEAEQFVQVLHLSTNDIIGGAARAAYRLHQGLCRHQGTESFMLVRRRDSTDGGVLRFLPSRKLSDRIRRRLRKWRIDRDFSRYEESRPEGAERFSDDRSQYGTELTEQIPPCDVINLHWVGEFVDYGALFRMLPEEVPVVWTLHDMNPFTGGCHYDQGCDRYVGRCGACPQLGSTEEYDLSRQIYVRKKAALSEMSTDRVQIVADSHWLAQEAQRSSLLGRFPVSVIHYGLDLDTFAPREHALARSVLGVPPEAEVLLFVSASVENSRKGFSLLVQALTGIEGLPNLFLLSVGGGKPGFPSRLAHEHLGRVGNDRFLSLIYSAADVFVIPSLQEAFGQTALEALACGTPVVGFDVGGIPDMVRPGITGLLARVGSVDELRDAIAGLLGDPVAREAMAENCRRIAVEEYALEVQARRYIELYEKVLSE